jgi:hypothetical protein
VEKALSLPLLTPDASTLVLVAAGNSIQAFTRPTLTSPLEFQLFGHLGTIAVMEATGTRAGPGLEGTVACAPAAPTAALTRALRAGERFVTLPGGVFAASMNQLDMVVRSQGCRPTRPRGMR